MKLLSLLFVVVMAASIKAANLGKARLESKLLNELDELESIVKGMKGSDGKPKQLPQQLQNYVRELPEAVSKDVGGYLAKLAPEKQRNMMHCGKAAMHGNLPHIKKEKLMPPKKVLNGLEKLPKDDQQVLLDFEGRLSNLINILLICAAPAVPKDIDSMMATAEQDHAKFDAWIKKLPKNVAWRVELYAMFLNPKQKSSLFHCGKKVIEKSAKQEVPKAAEMSGPKTEKVMKALMKIPEAQRGDVYNYGKKMTLMVNIMLHCAQPRE